MDRAKKKLASALDGFRSIHGRAELEFDEKVSPEHVCLTQIVRHGFPDDPRCIAYDCVQRLLAIGSGHGAVRILGDVGVDYSLKHPSDAAVLHVQLLINEVYFLSSM
uniref:PUM-HD domain-containing protein n=1 Tax=Ascaris lumbricoides TaxID=6252 RepID=A0A0M3IQV1_ASCLU